MNHSQPISIWVTSQRFFSQVFRVVTLRINLHYDTHVKRVISRTF